MLKFRLDCYTELDNNGSKPSMTLWFNSFKKAEQEGNAYIEHVSRYPAAGWYDITLEEHRAHKLNNFCSQLQKK